VAKIWQECECECDVHDKEELTSEQLVRLDFLRTSEDTTTSEVSEDDLLGTNTLYRNQVSGEEFDSDAASGASRVDPDHERLAPESKAMAMEELDATPEASQVALNQKNRASEPPTMATEELDTEDRKCSIALDGIAAKHVKVMEELAGRLKYDRLVTLIHQLGGEVECGNGSHFTIRDASKEAVGTIVRPHGGRENSWPGPKVRTSILRTAKYLMEQQLALVEKR
jgi:hypothetical protein